MSLEDVINEPSCATRSEYSSPAKRMKSALCVWRRILTRSKGATVVFAWVKYLQVTQRRYKYGNGMNTDQSSSKTSCERRPYKELCLRVSTCLALGGLHVPEPEHETRGVVDGKENGFASWRPRNQTGSYRILFSPSSVTASISRFPASLPRS